MKLKWPLLILTALVLCGSAYYFLAIPSDGVEAVSEEEVLDAAPLAKAHRYGSSILVLQTVDDKDKARVIDLQGELDLSQTHGTKTIASWHKVSSFELMGKVQDAATRESLEEKGIESDFDTFDQAYSHAFSEDFPRDFVPFHASLLHRVLLPFPLEVIKKRGKMTFKERDEVGDYEAEYTWNETEKAVKKQIVRYLGEGIKVDGRLNQFVFVFSSDDLLDRVEGRLALHYRQSTPTRFEIVIDLKRIGASDRSVASVDKNSAIVYSEADIAKGAESLPSSVVGYEEALQLVDGISEATDSKEVYRIFSSLKYAIDQDSSRSNDLIAKIDAIKERDANARRRLSVLFGALSQAQDPFISTQLAEMAESCPDNFCKIQAIAGVNTSPQPSPEALDKMIEIAQESRDVEISGNALLAAGAAGSRLDQSPESLEKILLETATDPSKAALKSAAIAAMGNHGSVNYLPALEASLKDPSSSLRAASAYSLRFIEAEGAEKALVGLLAQEKDQEVLRDALKALDYKTLSKEDYQKLASSTVKTGDGETQKIGARVLIQMYREDPSLAESALTEMKKATKEKDVKDYIDHEIAKIDAAKKEDEREALKAKEAERQP